MWVCKEHLDVPVNWKGRGCFKCEATRKKKTKKKVEEEDNTKAI